MPARKYVACTVPGCGNPHYALGECRPHYMSRRNRAAAALTKPIGPRPMPATVAPPVLTDTQPMPPAAMLPPPPAWRSEGVTLPPPAAPLVIRGGMTTAHRAAALATLPLPVIPAAPAVK